VKFARISFSKTQSNVRNDRVLRDEYFVFVEEIYETWLYISEFILTSLNIRQIKINKNYTI